MNIRALRGTLNAYKSLLFWGHYTEQTQTGKLSAQTLTDPARIDLDSNSERIQKLSSVKEGVSG